MTNETNRHTKNTPEFLRRRRAVIIADLLSKAEAEDWHGVADAAMDLREIDAKLDMQLVGMTPYLQEGRETRVTLDGIPTTEGK